MKNILYILGLFSLSMFRIPDISAQQNPSFFSLRAGMSVPFGSFSSYDLQESSFALTGINVSADGAWYFLPYLGVLSNPSFEELTIRSEPFQTIYAAAGIYADWNFWKSFSLTGKLLGGWMWAKTPYQLYKAVFYMVGSNWFEITSAKDNGFIMIPGIGLQYKISRSIGVKAEGELFYRDMKFGYYNYQGLYYDYKTISFVNISIGLVVLL
jgi:hypothetical protein